MNLSQRCASDLVLGNSWKHRLKLPVGAYQSISLLVAALDGAPSRLVSQRIPGVKIILNSGRRCFVTHTAFKKKKNKPQNNPNQYGIFIPGWLSHSLPMSRLLQVSELQFPHLKMGNINSYLTPLF